MSCRVFEAMQIRNANSLPFDFIVLNLSRYASIGTRKIVMVVVGSFEAMN